MARKTVLVCDSCSNEVDEGKGAVMRVTYNDARRGAKQLHLRIAFYELVDLYRRRSRCGKHERRLAEQKRAIGAA